MKRKKKRKIERERKKVQEKLKKFISVNPIMCNTILCVYEAGVLL